MKHIASKINWWKVASVGFMAASALFGLGHDLIEDKTSSGEMQQLIAEEVRKQLTEMNRTK